MKKEIDLLLYLIIYLPPLTQMDQTDRYEKTGCSDAATENLSIFNGTSCGTAAAVVTVAGDDNHSRLLLYLV